MMKQRRKPISDLIKKLDKKIILEEKQHNPDILQSIIYNVKHKILFI